MNEEQRQKLRRMEVALIEYRESLEERGIRSLDEIERKVAVHRKRLQSEFGLSDSKEDGSGNKRSSLERRDRCVDLRDSSKKRSHSQSRSRSPQRKSSSRDRDRDRDRDRENDRDRDKHHRTNDHDRVREREKSGSRERDDNDRDKGRERDRRRKGK